MSNATPDNPIQPSDDPQPALSDYLTCAQAARVTPGKPGPATVWRWTTRGVRLHDGTRVYLRCVRAGGKIFTTEAWIMRFVETLGIKQRRVDPPIEEVIRPQQQVTSAIRQRQIREAQERLMSDWKPKKRGGRQGSNGQK